MFLIHFSEGLLAATVSGHPATVSGHPADAHFFIIEKVSVDLGFVTENAW